MQPTKLKIRPQISLPKLSLSELVEYPELQLRINEQKYELTGIHNLIVELKKQTIQHLKQQFICNNNSVNLHQFLWLISNSVMIKAGSSQIKSIQQEYYQYEIEYEIVKVFQDIDIDNSNSISWQEYIEYITSSSLIQINQGSTQEPSEKIAKQLTLSHKEKTQFRKNPIRKIVEVEKLGLLAIVEKKVDSLTFISLNGSIPVRNYSLNGVDHNRVLSIDYSEDERMFGVLLNTHSVIFVEDSQMPKVFVDNRFSGNQVQIMYLKKHRLWLLLSLDGSIKIFSPQKSRKKTQSQKSPSMLKFKPHNEQLIGVHQLHNPLSIVSASWNNSIKIWSLSINQLLVDINPGKQDNSQQCKSIKGFEVFNNKHISYMICWMFAPEISVWLPSSSLTKPYLGKLTGHMGIVEQAKFLVNFAIVVSIDNKGSVRVWDLTKMQCIQNWKIQSLANLRVFALKSVPYVLMYDKLIQYYKSSKQTGLIQYNNQVKSSINYLNKPSSQQLQKQSQKSQPQTKRTIQDCSVSQKKPQSETQKLKQYEQQQIVVSKAQQKNNVVIATLYDTYLDVFIILTPDLVSVVAANSGCLVCKAYIENKNQSFVSICLKDNRRFFVGNTLGEILFFKTEDCSIQYKIYPFKQSMERDRQRIKLQQKSPAQQSKSNNKQILQHTIFAIDYNTYNKVLLVVGQCETNTMLVTFDNFTQFQPMKKKQIMLSQYNLSSFAAAQKYNMFYIASNRPAIVTIWDYHNFIILRTVAFNSYIYHVSCFTETFNLLAVVQGTAIRLISVSAIENKNNTRTAEINLFGKQMVIKNMKKVKKLYIHYQKGQPTEKMKKGKVTFQNQWSGSQSQPNLDHKDRNFQIFGISDSTVMLYIIDNIQTYFAESPQPLHLDKANITKQVKYFSINPTPCPTQSQSIDIGAITKVNISGSRRNVNILGYCYKIIYFQSDEGVLNLYKPDKGNVWAKLSIPKCQIIQWNVFFNLANKILARLKKAEKISKQTYAFKRKERDDEQKKQYLRLCFLLNKYFNEDDIAEIKKYLSTDVNKKKKNKQHKKTISQDFNLKAFDQEADTNEEKKSYFQHKFQQRYFNHAQAAQKIKSLQTMYSKVFNYIKVKRNQKQQVKGPQMLKSRCISAHKLQKNGSVQRNQSSSVFKIKNTVSSVNKMYFEHRKQIKTCLNKIGILNNKIKGLKL